jgi:hypothetical protein
MAVQNSFATTSLRANVVFVVLVSGDRFEAQRVMEKKRRRVQAKIVESLEFSVQYPDGRISDASCMNPSCRQGTIGPEEK